MSLSTPTRRRFLAGGASLALSPLLPAPFARAEAEAPRHGLSVFGELKYPADFKHFAYVRPDAPKGGSFIFSAANWYYNQGPNTFNTLNGYTFKGDAPPRVELTFDTLMTAALDEPDSVYGLVAESVAISADRNRYTFHLRDGVRFHDGSPLTAEDVAFSFLLLKEKGHPDIALSLREMTDVRANGPREVVVTFSGQQSAKAPLIVAGTLPIFSKAYYSARDFEASTLEPPLGSGPYKITTVNAGRSIVYERVEDYWGRDLPVAVGTGNFGRIRLEFYQDEDVEFEAFAKGELTWREEFSSKNWATRYNFPAIVDGRVKKPPFPAERRADMYGWFFNLRRPQFSDPRTRQAIGLVFDFPWTNKNLFYGLYKRSTSFFDGSDFAASGLPSPGEVALLEPFRADLPAAIFDEPAFTLPESDGSGRDRQQLRAAAALLAAAGWKRDGDTLVRDDGQRLTAEFLIQSQAFERVLSPYLANLKAIGVAVTIRLVDATQYQRRKNDFDFDIMANRIMFDATPIDGIEQIFGSAHADTPSGSNLSGIKNKVVDALVTKAGTVKSREELVTVLRALDRVLRHEQIWFPAWGSDEHRVAVWDMFGWPEEKPPYGFSPEMIWWFDAEKAVAIGKAD